MIGHLAVPALHNGAHTSATLSKVIIEDLLRKRLNYDGLVISDALNMHSVSKLYETKGQLEWEAFNAGNDVLCFAENVPEGIAAIVQNATDERIEESYNRIQKAKEKAGLLIAKQEENTILEFEAATALNHEIAKHCLTKIKGASLSEIVLEASNKGTLATVSIYKNSSNTFVTTLDKNLSVANFSIEKPSDVNTKMIRDELYTFDTILIALFVPKAKPQNNFDIDATTLTFLKELLHSKNCIIYLFGNPYALQVIPHLHEASGIIQVYQDFIPFQETAATLLINNDKYLGELPVTLDFN
jgi:beta-glucosidase-like glycosyl hydrolase